MIRKSYLPVLFTLALLLSGCGSKQLPLTADYFTATPQVLENVAGKVPVTINGKFPEKFFQKNAIIEVTPILKWNGGEKRGKSEIFQGESVQGNNKTIAYKTGGNFTLKTSFDYLPAMAKSELFLEFKATLGNKELAIPAVKIADGVLATSDLINQTLSSANLTTSADAFQHSIKEAYNANIQFLIQQANVRSSELNSSKIKDFNKKMAEVANQPDVKLTAVEMIAYTSPDGGVDLNTTLAQAREKNTNAYLSKEMKKNKITALLDAKYTAQDWEGFQELVSKSNIQDKQLILSVLSMYTDPAQREREIKNISNVYKTLADEILPQLRRSRLSLNMQIVGKSDEEILTLIDSNPSKLNMEEMLYAATLTNDLTKKQAIYTTVTQTYPKDYRSYNNLATLAYKAGDQAKTAAFLTQASRINPAPEVNLNQAVLALAKGNKNEAETLLGKASGADKLNEALGILAITNGEYSKAVKSFGDSKTNSAALAQVLSKDYNKAKNTLAAVPAPDAYTDYLMAIVGARTNNSSMCMASLKNAVKKNPALAKKALTDLEFSKFATTSEFLKLVK